MGTQLSYYQKTVWTLDSFIPYFHNREFDVVDISYHIPPFSVCWLRIDICDRYGWSGQCDTFWGDTWYHESLLLQELSDATAEGDQWWSQCDRIPCMVNTRQLWMAFGIHSQVRHCLCWIWQQPQEAPQVVGSVVQEVAQEKETLGASFLSFFLL